MELRNEEKQDMIMEENCETQLWKLVREAFSKRLEILTARQILERIRRSNRNALREFKDPRITAAISKIANQYSRSPIESCRGSGGNGYRLRASYDKEPPSFSPRGRPSGSNAKP